jgi:hypothetical protein
MYKHIWVDPRTQVSHIVVRWREDPFTACRQFHTWPRDCLQEGVATCVACWHREIIEWSIEAQKKGL